MTGHLLLFEPDNKLRNEAEQYISDYFSVVAFRREDSCMEYLADHQPDFVMTICGGRDNRKLTFLKILDKEFPALKKIIICPGKSEIIPPGMKIYLIREAITSARCMSGIKRLMDRNYLQDFSSLGQEGSLPVIIGSHPALLEQLKQARRIAGYSECALIMGETGTGKELIARFIHFLGDRQKEIYHVVNCAAINHTLFESEFFGYRKGAFTGATENKTGHFLKANRGTLVLDEITEIDLASQAKLLRVIENQELYAVGSQKLEKTDVRVIAVSNRNIEKLVREGRFRQDLFYRLNILSVRLPALRDRKSDIAMLSRYFVRKFESKYNYASKPELKSSIIHYLRNLPLSGNIRELQNQIYRMLVTGQMEQDRLSCRDLEEDYLCNMTPDSGDFLLTPQHSGLKERDRYVQLLKYHNFNISRAARNIGISRQNLQYRLKKLKINKREIR